MSSNVDNKDINDALCWCDFCKGKPIGKDSLPHPCRTRDVYE